MKPGPVGQRRCPAALPHCRRSVQRACPLTRVSAGELDENGGHGIKISLNGRIPSLGRIMIKKNVSSVGEIPVYKMPPTVYVL
jgi:hypothetical protein